MNQLDDFKQISRTQDEIAALDEEINSNKNTFFTYFQKHDMKLSSIQNRISNLDLVAKSNKGMFFPFEMYTQKFLVKPLAI